MYKLNSLGNPLGKLLRIVDFEMFRGGFTRRSSTILVPNFMTMCGCSRLLCFSACAISAMRRRGTRYATGCRPDFFRLASGDKVPDARIVWVYKNEQANKALVEILFKRFCVAKE